MTLIMTVKTKTEFQKEIETYFPELSDLLLIANTDKKVLVLIKTLVEMHKLRHFGKVEVSYQEGIINHILQTISKR